MNERFPEKTCGTMDALFNNAGLLKFGRYEDVDIAIHNKIVDVNVKGIMTCTHCAIPYLKSTPGSHLINMASTSAIYGIPELSVYAATKHAVCALTEAWDIELEQYGITVSDILAPFVKTPMLDSPDDVYSKKTFGIKLVPSDISEAVWKAVNGKKLHWWVGGTTYILFGLFQVMPFVRRFLIKKLTIK
jgi:short-subunit dehydrogenase